MIDVTSAGDTVIAVLAACVANMAAGVVVSKAGTSPITRKEFEAFCKCLPPQKFVPSTGPPFI